MAGVKRYEDLACRQLSYELQQGVFAATATGLVTRDLKFCDQIRESSRSATRNIAEGFGCQSHREFARFVRIGRRSLNEVQDEIRSAVLKEYLTEDDLASVRRLHRGLYTAITALLRHLDSGQDGISR